MVVCQRRFEITRCPLDLVTHRAHYARRVPPRARRHPRHHFCFGQLRKKRKAHEVAPLREATPASADTLACSISATALRPNGEETAGRRQPNRKRTRRTLFREAASARRSR